MEPPCTRDGFSTGILRPLKTNPVRWSYRSGRGDIFRVGTLPDMKSLRVWVIVEFRSRIILIMKNTDFRYILRHHRLKGSHL